MLELHVRCLVMHRLAQVTWQHRLTHPPTYLSATKSLTRGSSCVMPVQEPDT